MTTQETNLDVLSLRVDPEIAKEMVFEAVKSGVEPVVQDRLKADFGFLSRAIRIAQELLLTTTLAQTIAPQVSVEVLVASRQFSGNDPELKPVAKRLLALIMASPRIPDADIPDAVVEARFDRLMAMV